ncbi:MAG: hypothetical protein LBR76_01475 [Oscillospiraceae bacterium]|jgi:hypothetical protein|nr:hypothetical protein [Oscillospiraceae bacterium]
MRNENRKKKIEQKRRADDRFTWRVLGVMAFIALWTILMYRLNWPSTLHVLPSGAAVLYLLAYIYPKDFTLLAVYVSGGAFGLWLLTKAALVTAQMRVTAYILFAAALVVSALFFRFLRKHRGVVRFGKRKWLLMPPKAKFRYLFIAALALTLALIVSVIFGGTAAWCSLIAMFCYLFVMAVYYTVRLI